MGGQCGKVLRRETERLGGVDGERTCWDEFELVTDNGAVLSQSAGLERRGGGRCERCSHGARASDSERLDGGDGERKGGGRSAARVLRGVGLVLSWSRVENMLVSVAGVIAIIAHRVSERSKPMGIASMEIAVTAAAMFEELMLVFEALTVRSNTAEEVGAKKDGIVGRRSWCRVRKRNHAD